MTIVLSGYILAGVNSAISSSIVISSILALSLFCLHELHAINNKKGIKNLKKGLFFFIKILLEIIQQ
jgi:hypothetical protein